MKRLLCIALVLAGCASEEEVAKVQAAQSRVNAACDAGDLAACGYLLDQEAERRRAKAEAWNALAESLSDTGGYNNQRFQTTCTTVGISTTCY
jgi:hypothetical protein